MGKVYGYVRCSHADSAESGLGMEVQRQKIETYFRYFVMRQQGDEVIEWGGWFVDSAVSAYRFKLSMRPEGRKLCETMQRGDHVIFSRLDRGFRLLPDMLDMFGRWRDGGITPHFVEENLDLSTPGGQLMANVLGSVNQWYSQFLSQRSKEVAARLKAQGKRAGGRIKRAGYVREGNAYYQTIKPDPRHIRVLAKVAELRDQGVSWSLIPDALERWLCVMEHRPYKPRWMGTSNGGSKRYPPRYWSSRRIENAWRELEALARAELARQKEEEANGLPPTVLPGAEFDRSHIRRAKYNERKAREAREEAERQEQAKMTQ